MGCGGSQPSTTAPPPTEASQKDKVVGATWAEARPQVIAQKDRGTDAAATPVVLQDAEDDVEVEILTDPISEARPDPSPARTEATAANAQEAPSSSELSSPQQSPSRPLPKQQQEEAAKLAETRRRFDNQRYKNQGTDASGASSTPKMAMNRGASSTPKTAALNSGSLPNSFMPGALPGAPDIVEDFDMEPTGVAGRGAAASSGGSSGAAPDGVNHPLVVGLSLNKADGGLDESKLGASLPGGILDDSDLPGSAMSRNEEPAAKHQPLASFSADDEALMREILEDVDDLETV